MGSGTSYRFLITFKITKQQLLIIIFLSPSAEGTQEADFPMKPLRQFGMEIPRSLRTVSHSPHPRKERKRERKTNTPQSKQGAQQGIPSPAPPAGSPPVSQCPQCSWQAAEFWVVTQNQGRPLCGPARLAFMSPSTSSPQHWATPPPVASSLPCGPVRACAFQASLGISKSDCNASKLFLFFSFLSLLEIELRPCTLSYISSHLTVKN